MRNILKTTAVGAAVGGSLLFTGLGIASAQPVPAPAPDGLVNVSIGEAGVLKDVKAVDAAQIAAGVCDMQVDQVTKLAQTTEADGTEQTVCTNSLGSVLIQQNGAAEVEGLPATPAEGTPGMSGDEAPTTAPATPQEPSTAHVS
ncbi:hypothetical protein AB4Z42_03870 [Mycobacterium sp. 2YAF39]|uniref:hypothetical protein n=1 Tax=Mycobacterium sp. 2YAF39 TaxID=3233033 RepID=UPI003F94443F